MIGALLLWVLMALIGGGMFALFHWLDAREAKRASRVEPELPGGLHILKPPPPRLDIQGSAARARAHLGIEESRHTDE